MQVATRVHIEPAQTNRRESIASHFYGEVSGVQCTRHLSSAAAPQPAVQNVKDPKTGIVLINMGGPGTIDEVHDYLLKIMTDRDMIQLPVQSQLGPYIARRRTPEVQKKYSEIGGGSPILKWTKRQGELLCEKLDVLSPETAPHKYYVAFRYANPLTDVTLEEMEKDGLERAVLFSQYPQYCCSTTGSSFNAIYKYYKDRKVPPGIKWSIIDRWSTHPLLAKTIAERIRTELKEFPESIKKDVIIMFTAHSIPLRVVNRGDAYPSEVGYVKQGKKNFILVPVAFVNEHIETLHELDIEYCHDLGKELGVENIRRAAAPNDHPIFIDGLTDIVLNHLKSGPRISPKFLTRCPHCTNTRCEMSKSWFAQLCSQQ
uniref:Ferrochelatase n=1 Tax=Timema douglasi TaxID=61478 RepID=A0A7R8Z7R4_TIMDO|nr:unnamed protein product [Timema douglasi]